MKAYIVGPRDGGEGVYTLVAEDGQGMCEHFCSSKSYAMGDLYSRRPERREMFDKKGITEVVHLSDSTDMNEDELVKRNKNWHEATSPPQPQDTGGEDGK